MSNEPMAAPIAPPATAPPDPSPDGSDRSPPDPADAAAADRTEEEEERETAPAPAPSAAAGAPPDGPPPPPAVASVDGEGSVRGGAAEGGGTDGHPALVPAAAGSDVPEGRDDPPPSYDDVGVPSYPEDGPLVGRESMIGSDRVREPRSAVNDPVPVPSVYADGRGSIHNVSVGGRRINVIHTRRGVMRSGDVHPNHQCDFLFSGRARVWTLRGDGSTSARLYGPKEYAEIPPFVPHVFEFLEDSVMAEWWEDGGGEQSPFRAWFYGPYREAVDASFPADDENGSGGRMRGRLVELREVDEGRKQDGREESAADEKEKMELERKAREEEEKMREVILGCYTALAIGAVAFLSGVIVGFRRSK